MVTESHHVHHQPLHHSSHQPLHQQPHHQSHNHQSHHVSRTKDYSNNHHHQHSNASNMNGSDDYQEEELSSLARFFFGVLWCFAQVSMFGSALLFLYWILKFDKGFAWQNDKRKQFNLHAFLMIVGFIFLNGQSMLIYKTFLCCKRIYNKITHTLFFVLSISCITFGTIVAIQGQHTVPSGQTPVHFYSIHSWVGLTTLALFGLQFLVGFSTFLVLLCCEKATSSFRARMVPTHVSFGLIIYSLAIVACISGLLQTARFRLGGPTEKDPDQASYKNMTDPMNPFLNPALTINMAGACMILLGILMPYIVRNFTHRRSGHGSFSIN